MEGETSSQFESAGAGMSERLPVVFSAACPPEYFGVIVVDECRRSTFLLFLKMADERERLTAERQPIPAGHRGENLASPATEGAAS